MAIRAYDRSAAVTYARRWAFGRNPAFYDFSELGGDCTSYISQCIFAGACQMNFTPTFGWYFLSVNNRSPSWSGVQFLYDFLVSNRGVGPFATDIDQSSIEPGDVVQLGNEAGAFYHSLLVTSIRNGIIYVSAHTNDAYDRPLTSYSYADARYLHINGVRYMESAPPVCPDYMEVFNDHPSHTACV